MESNVDVCGFRAGVLTSMLHREGGGYGPFLVDHVSLLKYENQI